MSERCPRDLAQPLGRPQREHHLPWDANSLPRRLLLRPVPTAFRPGPVTGVAVVAFSRRGSGTNAIARSHPVFGKSTAGRRRSVNVGGVSKRNSRSSMPRPNASVVAGNGRRRRGPRRQLHRPRRLLRCPRRGARGHAAPESFTIFVIVRAATLRWALFAAARFSTVAQLVVRPHVGCTTGNASSRAASRKRPSVEARRNLGPAHLPPGGPAAVGTGNNPGTTRQAPRGASARLRNTAAGSYSSGT